MIVTLQNPLVDNLEKTYLSQSYNYAVTSVEVRSNLQFSANQRILLGQPGLAYSEVVTTGTVSADGTTIAIGATLYPHEADTPVYLLQFDQAKFYRSTTGANGTYTLLPNNPVNLDFTSEDLQTTYNDLTSVAGYYYEITVYNSITTVESAFSDPIPAISGWNRNQVGYIIEAAYAELSDANEQNFTRDEVIGYMNEVNDDLVMNVVKPYNFLYKRQAFGRVGGANTLAWPTDSNGNNLMWKFDRMDYNYVNNSTTPTTNTTSTVPVVALDYFRNRWVTNTSNPAVPSGVTIGLGAGGSLVLGKTYYYVVTATYSAGGESNQSAEVSATTQTGDQTIVLTWTGVTQPSGYNIYRGLSSGAETLLTNVSASTLSFTDNGTKSPGTQAPPAPISTQDDVVQEMALDESQQTFNYYPASQTSSNAVWYLYYWTFLTPITSEGNVIQTPTPKIYKHYINFKYYLKKAVTEPNYLQIAAKHETYYLRELMRYKGQDRRDVGSPRSFHNAGWVSKSYNRYV